MNLLSIDWFQLGVGLSYINVLKYDIRRLNYATKHFKIVEEIYYQNQKLFTVARQPHSSILPKDHHMIKWDNKFLYEPDSIRKGLQHLSILGLKLKNLTRLDLAIDFNTFKYGLLPNTFIDKFMKGDYIHNGRAKFDVIGRQGKINKFEYFRFGNPTSRCSIYLYNKSLEMQEMTFKQHIFEKWKANGLDVKRDIWRLEISLKTQNLDLINTETGEAVEFEINKCKDQEFLELIYKTTLSHYFRFKHKSKQKNKDRWKDVDLFNNITYDSRINFTSKLTDHDRSDKIFLRKLEQLNQELRSDNFELSTYCQTILNNFTKQRGLEGFYKTKILGE